MTQIQQPSQNSITTQQQSLARREESPQTALSGRERPTSDQSAAWQAYWRSQKQPWRTEPEIDPARQEQLQTRRTLTPNPRQGIYPFKEMKLHRADVEWLLATHENGKEPIDWDDEAQRQREGLDLRGADLTGDASQRVDLRGLPLARLRGGLTRGEWSGWARANEELLAMAAVHMEGADLFGTHLEGACLAAARLKQADLRLAGLEGADLRLADLERANLTGAQLKEANLTGAQLGRAYLTGAQLEKANLHRAQLKHTTLFGTQLKEAYLVGANLEGASLTYAQLEGADLRRAKLGRAILSGAKLGRTDLAEATLVDENGIGPRLAAVEWGDTDLSTVDWLHIKQLDDEYVAFQEKGEHGEQKDAFTRLNEFKIAVKAYRQLVLTLRTQGLSEEAAYFSYRAQVLHREIFRHQLAIKQNVGKPGQGIISWLSQLSKYLFSFFLDLTTGYGYKPGRSIITYLLVIIVFALAYSGFSHFSFLPNALVFSLTAFHGSGFFPEQATVSVSTFPNMVLTAFEAIVGLLMEISFIVVFTKRFLEQ